MEQQLSQQVLEALQPTRYIIMQLHFTERILKIVLKEIQVKVSYSTFSFCRCKHWMAFLQPTNALNSLGARLYS